MGETPKTEDECDRSAELAHGAVSDWDGQDNGDLVRLLAGELGLSLFEVKGLVEKLMQEDRDAYAAACETPIHGQAPLPAPAPGTSSAAGTEGNEGLE